MRRAAGSDSPWLSPKQAADYLGVSLDAIYDACATKGLRHSKLGHSTVRLRREWVDEWADSRARVREP
jgi:excisionase family DNA binding protein